jgi:hypothetical protein
VGDVGGKQPAVMLEIFEKSHAYYYCIFWEWFCMPIFLCTQVLLIVVTFVPVIIISHFIKQWLCNPGNIYNLITTMRCVYFCKKIKNYHIDMVFLNYYCCYYCSLLSANGTIPDVLIRCITCFERI